ncbi:TetR/AcrR family transcriptional regulator [Desulfoluna butyratoxydans]|uniref:Tetracycline transcriptional regulator tetr-related c-terminal n=1 Tax=Desulfoluna butyratoxydans TaxID=231438 RepID=A0A4U8YN44_9BACT|nr:TetR/AcrR family transcriptional regulator [Desulfoluna butyratoxydans]VFQ45495.1 tetracycline transcriptional regulator tetr-related c-terminal [Desulfoluna butyratoxydans]
MPRNKEYNHQDVLNAATSQFLDKGYKGVSVNDLVKATKLNKHSMYVEFGNKEGLFCACIDHYIQAVHRHVGHILRRQPLGLRNINDFFRHRIDYAYSGRGNGCLLLTTVSEKNQVDQMVLDRVQHHWTLQKADLRICLDAAKEQGEIPAEKDTAVLASHLFCQLMGMVIMIKGGARRQEVEQMIDMTLAHARQ